MTPPKKKDDDSSDVKLTDIEKEAFFIVKSILRGTVDIDKIIIKDYKGMCTLCYDAVRQVIVRLYFNNSNLKVGFLKIDGADPKKKDYDIVPISKVDDLYEYSERLKEIALFLASDKSVNDKTATA